MVFNLECLLSDFSIYETLINNGDINLVDFEVILKFGRLYRSMDDINTVQEKEREWRDFIENHLMQNYSDLFSTYGLPFGLFDFFAASKDDQVIYAHLKSILSVQGARRSRVQALRDNMKDIQAQLAELKEKRPMKKLIPLFLLIPIFAQSPLHYNISVPKDMSKKPATLFLMHGYGGNENGYNNLKERLKDDVVIVSMRAPFKMKRSLFTIFQNSNKWYDFSIVNGYLFKPGAN